MSVTTAFALTVSCLPLAQSKTITFATSIEQALADAKESQRPIVIYATAEHAAGAPDFVADCFHDGRIVELSRKMINVHFDHDGAVAKLRTWIGKKLVKNDNRVLAMPQVIVLTAQGRVTRAARGRMTPGQLEWILASSIAAVSPGLELSERARPPRESSHRAFTVSAKRAPTSKRTVAEYEAKLAADPNQYGAIWPYLIQSRSPAVLKQYQDSVQWYQPHMLRPVLEKIAAMSPRAWAPIAMLGVKSHDEALRMQAAKTLEVLRAPAAIPLLLKRLKKEKRVPIRIAVLRALATTGPTNRKVIAAIHRAQRDRKPDVRLQATKMLEVLESRSAIAKGLAKALSDKPADVKLAAASVIRNRRDAQLAESIAKLCAKEKDAEVRAALDSALEAAANGFAGK